MNEAGEFLLFPLFGSIYCGLGIVTVLFYIVFFAIFIIGLVLWIVMLIDLVQREDSEFPTKGSDQKVLWLLVILLGSYVGAIIYYLLVYRKMGKAGSNPR